jgi:hypothetical protein
MHPRGDRAGLERPYSESAHSGPFLRALLVAALALAVALLVASLSAMQVSERDNALPVLGASVEALTEPELLVSRHLDTLHEQARENPDQAVIVPGFPIEVSLSAEETTTLDGPALADLLVDRASVLLYADGMDAFDRTGNQHVDRFSWQGVVRALDGRLTKDAHASATTAFTVMLFVTAGLAVPVVLSYREDRRLRALGIAVLAGSLSGLLAVIFAIFMVSQIGSDDPFVKDVREIVKDVFAVWRRNYTIVVILGVVMTATSLVLRFVSGRQPELAMEGDDEDEALTE